MVGVNQPEALRSVMKASRVISSDAGSSPMPSDSRPASLEERSPGCDLVLCSTALRARQALEIVRPVLGSPEVRFDDAICRADVGDLIALLQLTPSGTGRVMVVGYDPVLQMTVQSLALSASGEAMDRFTREYSTSAFAMLTYGSAEWASFSRGHGASRVLPRSSRPLT